MPEFDAYVMVDWSASNVPVHGPNSIWVCAWDRHRNALNPDDLPTWNPHTRSEAVDIVRAILHQHARVGRRTLVGFDFAYGYPRGFAVALGLGGEGQPWRQTWHRLAHDLHDSFVNENNRFQVAASFNALITNSKGPFWGHHPAWAVDAHLPTCNPGFPFEAENSVVRGLITYFAQLDDDRLLLPLFRVPFHLPPDKREEVLMEEGWTLGA